MARPLKVVDENMVFISETLEDVHVSDECNQAFNKWAEIDDKKNPEKAEKAAEAYEEEWNKSYDQDEMRTEAKFVNEVAIACAKKCLRPFRNWADLENNYMDFAQEAVMSIIITGKYDNLMPMGQKVAHIKKRVQNRIWDYARRLKIENERSGKSAKRKEMVPAPLYKVLPDGSRAELPIPLKKMRVKK